MLEKQLKAAGHDVNRFDMISVWSRGEKRSFSDMTDEDYRQFIAWIRTNYSRHLNKDKYGAQAKQQDWEDKKKSVKTAVHYLCLCGMVTTANQPDYDRINDFVRNIGSNNPRRVDLRQLNATELNKVVSQIKAMYQREIQK